MQQCTLYMTLASRDDFFPLLARLLSGWSLENRGDTLIAARRKLLSRRHIAFHLKSRDVDGASFTEMMQGMHDFFAAIPTDKESLKQSLLAQIKVFTLCVGVVADKDMDDATFGAVMTVAGEGHGLIFLPPADLYAADGATVFNADGESDFDSWTVTAPAALLVPPKATASGEERKERNNTRLAAEGVPISASLPPIVGDAAYLPRSVEEVAQRTLGILLTSVFAELVSSRGVEAARASIADLLEQYSARDFLSPGERAFISGPAPEGRSLADFTWRYECAWVGLWALGLVDTLAYPGAVCDVGGWPPWCVVAAIIRVFCGLAACARRRRFWTRRTASTAMTGPARMRGSKAGTLRPGLIPAWSWNGTECSTGSSATWTPPGMTCVRTRSVASPFSGIRRSSPGPVPPAR